MGRAISHCPKHGEYMEFGPTYSCQQCEWETARQEWLDERAAVLEYDAKFPRHEAERLAVAMWEAKVQRENASAGHAEGPKAHGGENTSQSACAVSGGATTVSHKSDSA